VPVPRRPGIRPLRCRVRAVSWRNEQGEIGAAEISFDRLSDSCAAALELHEPPVRFREVDQLVRSEHLALNVERKLSIWLSHELCTGEVDERRLRWGLWTRRRTLSQAGLR
jgi:hypothetical protein